MVFQETGNLEQRKNAHKLKRNRNFHIKGQLLLCRSCLVQEWKSARTSSGIHHEKKSSSLLKVGKRSIDSSDSKSFEALENKPKFKFAVEDNSSVMMGKGEEDDCSEMMTYQLF